MDARDGNIDGIEDLDVEEVAESEQPYGEVTAEDLSAEELVYDGADPANMLPDDTAAPVDEAMHENDTETQESLDERLRQEEPDPAAETTFGGPTPGNEQD